MGDRFKQQLGNYHLVHLLGRGSFAEVYLGEHMRLKSYAALKILRQFFSDQDQEDFLTEGRTLVRLKHQHIVRLLDLDIKDDTPFLVMEYAAGGTLRKLHPKGSQVALEKVVSYVQQVAEALDYAHALSVVHRDIKPENMLLGAHEEVLLSDFGIATISHGSHSFRSEQRQAGTLPYMAPEQLRKHPVPSSDQYALGVVAYEWLCGSRPFAGNEWTLIYKHLHETPPPLRDKNTSLPEGVEQVIARALAKEPQERFATVCDFAQALAEAAGLNTVPYRLSTRVPTPPLLPHSAPRLLSDIKQESPDFSTCLQEQSPVPSITVLQGSPAREDQTPTLSERVELIHQSSGSGGAVQTQTATTTRPVPSSWLHGTWTQKLILFSLTISLIAAGLDIAFTLTSWQHSFPDNRSSATLDDTEIARRREQFYQQIVSQRPDATFPLNHQDSASWTQGPGCQFSNDGYHVGVSAQTNRQECVGKKTHYEDFAFQVQMTILHGDGGGLLFRAYFQPRQLYHFQITPTGHYELTAEPLEIGTNGESKVIKTGKQENTLTVITRDEQTFLYINGHYIGELRDRQSLSGSLGVFAVRNRGSPPVEIVFHNAKVWVL